jgi:oxalate decarboxylase
VGRRPNNKFKKTQLGKLLIMSILTRRNFLGSVAAAGGLAALQKVVGAEGPDRSKTDPGPANPTLDGQNPDSIWPPSTDSKSLVQNFKYPFSFANKRTYEGGWSREVTVGSCPSRKPWPVLT